MKPSPSRGANSLAARLLAQAPRDGPQQRKLLTATANRAATAPQPAGRPRAADAGKKAFLTLRGLAAREIMPIFANGAKREDEDITRIPASVCAGILSFYDSFPHGSAPGKTMINA